MAPAPQSAPRSRLRGILPVLVAAPWLWTLCRPAVDSGDSAVYLAQAAAGDLAVRSVHVGYLLPLSLALGAAQGIAAPETVARVLSVACALAAIVLAGRLGERLAPGWGWVAGLGLAAHPAFVAEVGRVEVYLPQLAALLGAAALAMWARDRDDGRAAAGAGALLGLAGAISPTSIAVAPAILLLSPRRRWGWLAAGALAAWAPLVLPRWDDLWSGPRGLLRAPPRDQGVGRAAVALLEALVPGWGGVGALALLGALAPAGARIPRLREAMALTLAATAALARYRDVPWALPMLGLAAPLSAGGFALLWTWRPALPGPGALLGAGAAILLGSQLVVADTGGRRGLREAQRWEARCRALEQALRPEDTLLGPWGELTRLSWCLSGAPADPRALLREAGPEAVAARLARGRVFPVPAGEGPAAWARDAVGEGAAWGIRWQDGVALSYAWGPTPATDRWGPPPAAAPPPR